YEDAKTYRHNIFDLTKTIPQADYPRIKVGTMELNRNPENFFAEIEQAALSPANMVPGIGMSPDKMLLGRNFAYADAQRYRIGTNFQQLPVNRPINEVHTHNFEGNTRLEHTGARRPYVPHSRGDSWSADVGAGEVSRESDAELVRSAYTLREDDSDFIQPNILVNKVFSQKERDDLVDTVAGGLETVIEPVLSNAIQYWKNIDETIGQR